MSKIDKKSIVVLLILTIVLTIIAPTVNAAGTIEVDPQLDNSGVTAMSLGNRVLVSDGTLWKINSKTNVMVEDKNVKQYNYVYAHNYLTGYAYYAKLKNDKNLYITSTSIADETKVKETKTISNVKKIVEQYDGSYLAYLTYTNELYFLDPDEGEGNVSFDLVAKDVEKLIGQYYIKDGKTYLANGHKILDAEIDGAYKDYCYIGNTLYEAFPYSLDQQYFKVYATDFKEFRNTNNTNGWMTYIATDGTTKETGSYGESQSEYYYHAVDGYMRYYLSGSNVFASKNNTVFVLLKNVVDMNQINETTIVFVRSDGTVWVNTMGLSQSCTKLISQKPLKFTDINTSAWYFVAVNYVVNNNIKNGLNETKFGPNDKLTRAMMVSILYKMEKSPEVPANAPTFPDVKDSSKWYYKAVRWAAANKIVNGNNNGTFNPTGYITREQLAIMLHNYAKYKGKNVSASGDLTKFTDYKNVASYALNAMKWAVGSKVITGSNGKLNPKGTATRAETAAMIQKYCINVGR